MTETYDITITQGTTFSLPITIRDKGCKTGKDLSNATITGTIISGSPQVQFTTVPIDLSNGTFELKLTSSQTSALSLTNNVGKYQVKINYTGSPEDIDLVLRGRVVVLPE